MKKLLVLVILVSLGVNISLGIRLWQDNHRFSPRDRSWGPADRPGPGGPAGADGGESGVFWSGVMERRLNHVVHRLGLDQDQENAFRNTHQKAAERFLRQRNMVQEARRRLMVEASGEDFSGKRLRPLIAEVGRQQVKLDSMVTETMLQEMDILDPEQRLKYLRILPLNRFGSRGCGPGHKPDFGSGGRRH